MKNSPAKSPLTPGKSSRSDMMGYLSETDQLSPIGPATGCGISAKDEDGATVVVLPLGVMRWNDVVQITHRHNAFPAVSAELERIRTQHAALVSMVRALRETLDNSGVCIVDLVEAAQRTNTFSQSTHAASIQQNVFNVALIKEATALLASVE